MYGFSGWTTCPSESSLEAISHAHASRMGNHPGVSAEPAMLAVYHERLDAARRRGRRFASEKHHSRVASIVTHTYRPVGWVVMHEDVTEQTGAEVAARARRERASIRRAAASRQPWTIFPTACRSSTPICGWSSATSATSKSTGCRATSCVLASRCCEIAKLRVPANTAPAHQPDFLDLRFESKRAVGALRRDDRADERPVHRGHAVACRRRRVFVAVHQDITEQIERPRGAQSKPRRNRPPENAFRVGAREHLAWPVDVSTADGRLVICNARYQQIYDAPDELCQPGLRYSDLVARRDSSDGLRTHSEIGRIRRRRAGRDDLRHRDDRGLPDEERPHAVSVRHSTMPDGGFIRIHQDITGPGRALRNAAAGRARREPSRTAL